MKTEINEKTEIDELKESDRKVEETNDIDKNGIGKNGIDKNGIDKSKGKKALKIILIVLLVIILAVLSYVAYVFGSYYRIDDNQKLTVELSVDASAKDVVNGVSVDKEYTISTYNIGFGAYSNDYSFFMDGGTESRGRSEEAVKANVSGAAETVKGLDADIMLFQEVDTSGTRSYDVNEKDLIKKIVGAGCTSTYAQNYDSPYLLYPITDPHGSNQSGILTLTKFTITSGLRRSLPIEDGFMKIVDLDRCYSVSRIPVAINDKGEPNTVNKPNISAEKVGTDSGNSKSNTKELVVYNVHLSAYTSDGKIAEEQLKMLFNDMMSEYKKGNYVIAGGDFNKDLLGNASESFGVPAPEGSTWAQAIPKALVPKDLTIIAPYDKENPVASCRNANEPYEKGHTFVITVDGFVVSPNVEVTASGVTDTGYKYSDHTPVHMNFKLK